MLHDISLLYNVYFHGNVHVSVFGKFGNVISVVLFLASSKHSASLGTVC